MDEPIIPVPKTAVVLVAAGAGTRLGAGTPKAFVSLAGEPLLAWALRSVRAVRPAMQVVVVVPPGREGETAELVGRLGPVFRDLVRIVPGRGTRQGSVAAGLAALWGDVSTVLVHDAARAFVPPEVFSRVVTALEHGSTAVVPVLPVVDALKRVEGNTVLAAVDRDALAAAQTPQGFQRSALVAAYAAATTDHADDAGLMQAAGHVVSTVPGDERGFKITTPADLERASALAIAPDHPDAHAETLAAGAAAEVLPRIGVGTDVHAFGGEPPLWLAGLCWPEEASLLGHSDGDAVAHAIVDALLAAAGLGDIGTQFGTDRPELAGAHGAAFLAATREQLSRSGWRIGNVSVQVQAARPRFAARRGEAEAALSAALGASVSVSATTTDGLGFVGAGDGVQAFAVAILFPA